jgi:hypothetical protein
MSAVAPGPPAGAGAGVLARPQRRRFRLAGHGRQRRGRPVILAVASSLAAARAAESAAPLTAASTLAATENAARAAQLAVSSSHSAGGLISSALAVLEATAGYRAPVIDADATLAAQGALDGTGGCPERSALPITIRKRTSCLPSTRSLPSICLVPAAGLLLGRGARLCLLCSCRAEKLCCVAGRPDKVSRPERCLDVDVDVGALRLR